jgi:hypothetical protein
MIAIDQFNVLRDWRLALYRGDAAVVDRFLGEIDAALPNGWARDPAYEQTRLKPDRVRCYLFDRGSDAAVRVWLQRVTSTRVRGGPVQVLRHPLTGDTGQIGKLVADFAAASVLPAVTAAGISQSRPMFGPRSALTTAAEMLFTQLADRADGKWPLDQETGLWDELISTCLAENVAIDRADLIKWLEDSGWKQAAVPQIADRFFTDSEVLAKRLAVQAS